MLCYWHKSEATPPSWLLGAAGVSSRQVAQGYAYGIGDGFRLSEPPSNAVALVGGWLAWVDGTLDPISLKRDIHGLRVLPLLDGKERIWYVPVIINYRGERFFDVPYDENWLPVLSQEEKDMLTIATEVRSYIDSQYRKEWGEDEVDLVEPRSLAWTSRVLAFGNHVTQEILGKLHLMDGFLCTGSLFLLSSIDPPDDV
jgi:hypothetical protein